MTLYAWISPNSKWKALKFAERLVESEIWKFRTRVGDYSILKFNTASIVKNLRIFIKNITKDTIQKANLNETLLMTKQPNQYARHYQYKQSYYDTSYFYEYGPTPVFNSDEALEPLNAALIEDYSNDFNPKLIDNH